MSDNTLFNRAEYDALRFSEFCMCPIEDARRVITLCRDYAQNEKEYWQNINKAITRWQSNAFPIEGVERIQELLNGVKELPSSHD